MLKNTIVKKVVIIVVIYLLTMMYNPIVLSDYVYNNTVDNKKSNYSLNGGGIADNVSISINGPFFSFFSFIILSISLKYRGPRIYCQIYINITKLNGTKNLFNDRIKQEFEGDMEVGFNWKYRKFIFRDHPFGHFDVNVTIVVENDNSVKYKTAHGQIFLYYIFPWVVYTEKDNT